MAARDFMAGLQMRRKGDDLAAAPHASTALRRRGRIFGCRHHSTPEGKTGGEYAFHFCARGVCFLFAVPRVFWLELLILDLLRTVKRGPALPTADQVNAGAACATAVVTAIGAWFVYQQIHDANVALFANNSYTVHKDIVDAYDQLLGAKNNRRGKEQDEKLKDDYARAVLRFDGLVENAEGLKNNEGLSPETWKSILVALCPTLPQKVDANAQVAPVAAQKACARDARIWETTPK